ncbi:MAG: CDP-archaeol synthase [Thermodesulfobacteriota bacterium]
MTETLLLFAFLLWVNVLPPLASLALSDRWKQPLDFGLHLPDGQFLFGPHKTIRGVVAALLGGTLTSPLLGVRWQVAAVASLLAVLGDLASSCIKRRLRHPSGTAMLGLDQCFEALLPAWYLGGHLGLPVWPRLAVGLGFIPLAHAGALFWKEMLFRPAMHDYPRVVRSTVRLREWRACHQPLARWHTWFNLSNLLYNEVLLTFFFKAIGRYEEGMAHARELRLEQVDLPFADLPPAFDGFRILLLTDLHLDGVHGLTDALIAQVRNLEADLCLIGGDLRMKLYGPFGPALRRLKRVLPHIRARYGIFGVLGNHDCIEMVPDLEEAGILMLVNDNQPLEREGQTIWLVGLDDPHYYRTNDEDTAFRAVPAGAFTILLAHSPEAYRQAAAHGARLYLCGHTHAGQIRPPGRGPIYTNSSAPRHTAEGRWYWQGMTGYTSRGIGASSVPLRFNCPGEVTRITLRKGREMCQSDQKSCPESPGADQPRQPECLPMARQ